MARVEVGGVGLEVFDTGVGDQTVCFSHGLLWDHRMFLPQIHALRGRYRCVAWDHRGQGRSGVPSGRVVTIEEVTSDAVRLVEQLGVGPVHFVGLSMGGFVGMRIAARRPELVRSLSLLETAPDVEPPENVPKYLRLLWVVRLLGVRRFVADRVLKIMCGASFLNDPRNEAQVDELRRRMQENRRSIRKAVLGVIEREGVEAELRRIRCPTLVLRGTEDAAIARDRSRKLLDGIPHAEWAEVEGCGHTSSLERPEAVTEVLVGFLDRVARAPDHSYLTPHP